MRTLAQLLFENSTPDVEAAGRCRTPSIDDEEIRLLCSAFSIFRLCLNAIKKNDALSCAGATILAKK